MANRSENCLRIVSAPLDARRLGFELRNESMYPGLCTDEFPLPAVPLFVPAAASLPAMLRREREEPDRDPSDSGCRVEREQKKQKVRKNAL